MGKFSNPLLTRFMVRFRIQIHTMYNAILGYVTYVEMKIKFKSKKPEVEVMMYEQQVNYMI